MHELNVQILPQCAQKQSTVLWNESQPTTKRFQTNSSDVLVVNQDSPILEVNTTINVAVVSDWASCTRSVSTHWNKAWSSELFPAPVRPTIPTYFPVPSAHNDVGHDSQIAHLLARSNIEADVLQHQRKTFPVRHFDVIELDLTVCRPSGWRVIRCCQRAFRWKLGIVQNL